MSETPAKPSPQPKKPPISRGQKWRRRIIIALSALILLSILGRALVPALLPPVLRKVAGGFGMTATYDRLELYALSGDIGIWNLRFTPLEGGNPILSTSYCRASISTLALLRGKLTVNRVEAEDADVLFERRADGTVPLLQKLVGQSKSPAPPATSNKPTALSLDSPLRIDVLRLQNGKAHIRDLSLNPPTDVSLLLDLLVTNIGSPTEKAHVDMQLHSPEALVALYVSASGTSRDNQLDADLSVKMYGLNLFPAAAYLAPLGIVPVSNNISAQMSGHLQARVNTPISSANATPPSDLSATLALDDLQLTSDGQSATSVKSVKINIPSLSPGAIRIASIDFAGIRANASRTKAGRLAFGGVEIVPAPPAPARAPAPVSPKPISAAPSSSPPIIELQKLSVEDVGLSFDDSSLQEPVKLALNVPTITIEHVSTDPTQANQPATLQLEASGPGMAKKIEISGSATIAQPAKRIDLNIDISGISPTAAKPYLDALGLKNELANGDLRCAVSTQIETKPDGSLLAWLGVKNIRFTDGNRELFLMPSINVDSAAVSADASHIKIGSIAINGPVLPIERNTAGAFSIFGLQLVTKSPAPALATAPPATPDIAAAPAAVPATQPVVSSSPPSIEIDHFAWHGAGVALHDLQPKDPLKLAIQDVNLDIEHLVIDPASRAAAPGAIHFTMRSPGVMDRFNVEGTIASNGQSLALNFKGHGAGITGNELKPVLASLGLESVLHDGDLHFSVDASATQADGKMSADLAVRNVSLNDGSKHWLSLEGFQVNNATFDGSVATIDAVRIDKPSALIVRDSDGLISAAGIKLLPSKPTPGVATTMPAPETPTRIDLTLPIIARLKSFELNNAEFQLQDAAVLPTTNLSAIINATMENLAMGEDAPPSPFSITISSPGVIDSLNISGHAKIAPQSQQIDLAFNGEGISGQALEPYLPPNAKTNFNNGSFSASLAASIAPNPQGGSKASLIVSDVQLTNGISAAPVAAMKSLRVGVDRIDLLGRRIALNEIAVEGVQAAAVQDDHGLSLMGLTFAPHALRPVPPPRPVHDVVAPAGGASDVNALMQESKVKPPLVTLKKLSIQADRFSFMSSAMAKPLALANLSLTNAAPIELLGDDPTQRAPFDLQLKANVEGLVDSIVADAHLAPFAAEPAANLDLNITGIHANELKTFMPKLKDTIDGRDLSNGRFTSSTEAHFKFTRRGAAGIDLTRDITTDFSITNTRLTQAGVDRPLAGVDEIRGESVRFSPGTGALAVKLLAIEKPMARVVRDRDGIHLLGLTLKSSPPATQPTTKPEAATAPAPTAPAIAKIPPATQPAATAQSPEMRIDRFTITNVDFVIEDHLGAEPTIIPINALDVDIKGLSTAALTESKAIRFSAIVGAGDVSLPANDPKKSGDTEERPVFSEASASGNLVLFPKPKGYVKCSLSGLEMSAMRGLASQAKIKIDRGTFDLRTDVRMEGTDNFDARVYPTFNDLRISEPPDGPISRLLKLPAPLNVIVSTLEDSDGSISLPVTVPLEAGKLDTDAIIGSAASSIGRAIADAMLAAPLKAANLVASLTGADTGNSRTKPIEPVVIDFAPGESQLTADQRKTIDDLLERLRKDDSLEATLQHTLGAADVALVRERSNPIEADSLALASRFRWRKQDLQQQEAEQSSRLRVALASQNQAAVASALADLRATSIELKEADDSLDQVLSLLQPGADRQSNRRTRAAAILLGDLRLRAIQQAMLQSNIKSIAEHVRKANALFNPADSNQPGHVSIILVRRAKQ